MRSRVLDRHFGSLTEKHLEKLAEQARPNAKGRKKGKKENPQ